MAQRKTPKVTPPSPRAVAKLVKAAEAAFKPGAPSRPLTDLRPPKKAQTAEGHSANTRPSGTYPAGSLNKAVDDQARAHAAGLAKIAQKAKRMNPRAPRKGA